MMDTRSSDAAPTMPIGLRRLSHRWLIAIAWAAVIFTLATGVFGGLHRGMNNEPDWRAFARETQYVWEHHTIPPWTGMFGYLPAAFIALLPITVGLPRGLGVPIFVAGNSFAAMGTAWLLYRWWFAGPRVDRRLFVWPMFLMVAHLQHVLQGNQLTIWVLFLCIAGLTLVMHRRDIAGGLLVGMAGCLKVTPLAFLLFFLLRRQWRTVSGMLLAIIAFDVLPSCAFFGMDGAIREHANWLRRVEWYSNGRFIDDPWLRITRHGHDHNCSLAVVLTRWLRASPRGNQQVVLYGDPPGDVVADTRAKLLPDEHLTIDPMPEGPEPWSIGRYPQTDRSKIPRFHAADLSAGSVKVLWIALEVLVVGGIALATFFSNSPSNKESTFTAQAAVWLILMLWPSPMVRDYYLALAIPACVVAWRAVLERGRERMTPGARLATAAVFGSYISVICLSWDAANWYGIHLWTFVALGAAAAWAWRAGRVAEESEGESA